VLPGQATGPRELLYLGTNAGVTAVDPVSGAEVFRAGNALPAGDWSILVEATRGRNATTTVEAIDSATGDPLATGELPGRLRVRTVSFDGRQFALMPNAYGAGGATFEGRATTKIVVDTFDGAPPRTLDVEGNVEPEAFSRDGGKLFLLEYTPALKPTKYQVRELDITTGRLNDIPSQDLRGTMEGVARGQVLSPDGTYLHTLYTTSAGRSFVHVLNLFDGSAVCVDLPAPFGRSPETMAIATAPDDGDVYVADAEQGHIVRIEALTLRVNDTAKFEPIRAEKGHVTLAGSESNVYVSRGTTMRALHRGELDALATWRFESSIQGVQPTPNHPRELYVAERRRISRVDGITGERLASVSAPTGLGISHVGYAVPQTSIGSYQCAC
jgi:hypothetical protein